jgi:signal recognition particle subunit SRP54
MFTALSSRLDGILNKLKGRGTLDEKAVDAALREIKLALLEADVNYKVVKEFTAGVRQRALGRQVLSSITPGQQVVGIVHDELVKLLGGEAEPIRWGVPPPVTIMLTGLQGSGKTTTAGKLGSLLKRQGKRVMLVAADVYRPAAVHQLRVLAKELGVQFYAAEDTDPVEICARAVELGAREIFDVVIMDTAGRLHIDEAMMEELVRISRRVDPTERLLVLDGMTGQDAVTTAAEFNQKLGLTGTILTKLDGDARGGAALSVRAITGTPIKFIGIGERLDDLETFHPTRIASRILGMGDVVTLVEKAQLRADEEKAHVLRKKVRKGRLTLDDFLDQVQQIKQMGSLEQLVAMIPGAAKLGLGPSAMDDRELVRIEAMIRSMTKEEREKPGIINGSRRKRIARGSGTRVQEVNRLLKEFTAMQKMMRRFGGGKVKPRALLGGFQ